LTVAIAVTLALAVLIGVTMGLLGGGGSILTVPLLLYVTGMEPKQAIVTSLFVVGVTGVAAVLQHARAGRVRWRTGLVFGLAGMVGAFGGGTLGSHLPGEVLVVAFAVVMLAAAVAMLRGRRARPAGHCEELRVGHVVLQGVAVGAVAGMVGAGGGFLVVPALVLFGGLPMAVAVGTSLMVISMQCFAALAGYLSSVSLDWPLTLAVTAATVVGSLIGGQLVAHVRPEALRRAFGWFVLVMGAVVLAEQLTTLVGI
jgi:uncharacterized membrane protein YfcA